MTFALRALGPALLCQSAATTAANAGSAPLSKPAETPVPLRGAIQFDMPSKISGRTYRVFVFQPALDPPAGGYPVLTVLDGQLTFPIAATMSSALMMQGGGALVVGVGYPADDLLTPQFARLRDLTPPTPLANILAQPGMPAPKAEDYGGANAFRRFLTEELRPAIAARYPVNDAEQTLFGHSLGGLFTLSVLFQHPEAFRTFAASSPSIWWNKRALLDGEAAFAKRIRGKAVTPRVLVTMGALEQTVPKIPPMNLTRAQVRKLFGEALMVDNARALGERLGKLRGGKGWAFRYVEFTDEDHMTVVPAAISRALAFATQA
jgi:uncharacterized protein